MRGSASGYGKPQSFAGRVAPAWSVSSRSMRSVWSVLVLVIALGPEEGGDGFVVGEGYAASGHHADGREGEAQEEHRDGRRDDGHVQQRTTVLLVGVIDDRLILTLGERHVRQE